MHRIVVAGLLSGIASSVHAQSINVGPDAAVGTVEERLAASIVFDSTGTFEPGQGLAVHVRLAWDGTAAFKSRVVYRGLPAERLTASVFTDARRSAFFNFVVTGARVVPGALPSDLPAALEYDVRQAMSFGKGGAAWTFYVPTPRVMVRIPPTREPQTEERRQRLLPAGLPPELRENVRKVLDAEPPAGQLPVGDVGRWTARARYTLADGMYAAAPAGRRIETDFAVYQSTYTVDGRDVVMERTFHVKKLTLPPEREAELHAFYTAVDQDRQVTFSMTAYPDGRPTPADLLNEEGLRAVSDGAIERAAERFRQAAAIDPQHRWALYNLASVQLMANDAPAAVESSQRALAIDVANPSARLVLARALEVMGRVDEAEKVLREQVERLPWSAWSLDALARFYAGRKRPADALPFWRRASEAGPRDEQILLSYGRTLVELGRPGEAATIWQAGLELSLDGMAFNAAAWALADRGVELEAARQLAGHGLGLLVKQAIDPSPMAPARSRLELTRDLPAIWDTTGWIEFKAGRHDEAVAWLRAAWQLSENAEVAEHLAAALSAAKRPPTEGGTLAPDASEETRRQARTMSLERGPASAWRGAVDLAYDRTGTVRAIVSPGSAPAEVLERLRSVRMPFQAPPDQHPYRLDRRVTVTCPGSGQPCSAVLMRPDDVPAR